MPSLSDTNSSASFPENSLFSDSASRFFPSLGNITKYSAEHYRIDPDTGEILEDTFAYSPMNSRVERFSLQSVARKILPNFRTAVCLRHRQKNKDVQVWQSREFSTAFYSGLQVCGSVWTCPVCAAKIAERRRAEIISAMTLHKAAGGFVNLLTLTAPHSRTDKLAVILEMQAVALKYFNKDFTVRRIYSEMGIIGQIRALEVTHGRNSNINNGWHPHYHLLLFINASADSLQRQAWADTLYIRWAACCVRSGLSEPSRLYGLRLDDGSKASSYVSKWGLEDEMTKGHTKKSAKGETPFDFLRAYLADGQDKQAAILFREFAEAFKGKRQLHWSKGLKKLFSIGDLSDDELSSKIDDNADLLATLSLDEWRDVLRADARGLLLHLAVSGGYSAIRLYLDSLSKIRPFYGVG